MSTHYTSIRVPVAVADRLRTEQCVVLGDAVYLAVSNGLNIAVLAGNEPGSVYVTVLEAYLSRRRKPLLSGSYTDYDKLLADVFELVVTRSGGDS